MSEIIRDPDQLNPETRLLWEKQEGLIKIYNLPFRTFETLRSADRQKELLAEGKTNTLNSNHLTGDAWDVAEWNGDWSWKDEWWFRVLAIITLNMISGVAWGGNWTTFKGDLCHYERKK